MLHDDGDNEDLEQHEIDEALARYISLHGEDQPVPRSGVNSRKRKAESSDTETEDDTEDEDDEDDDEADEEGIGPNPTIWPSFEARLRWQRSVESAATSGCLALAAMMLRDHIAAFGYVCLWKFVIVVRQSP